MKSVTLHNTQTGCELTLPRQRHSLELGKNENLNSAVMFAAETFLIFILIYHRFLLYQVNLKMPTKVHLSDITDHTNISMPELFKNKTVYTIICFFLKILANSNNFNSNNYHKINISPICIIQC